MTKALFLDRDGIINKDVGYASKPQQIEFVAGIFSLCRYFQQKGYLIIVVTNQSGIARGYYSEEDFKHLTKFLHNEFSKRFISITRTYHCPHHPSITGRCQCRKPEPGMLYSAIKRYKIDPQSSIMIGDKQSDMQAAKTAGIGRRIFLRTDAEKFLAVKPATYQMNQLIKAQR